MWGMDSILVPIDFSRVTRCVVTEAIRLASRRGGRIVLLHVVNPPGLAGGADAVFTELAPLIESLQDAAAGELERWRLFVGKRYRDVDAVQAAGYPALEIGRAARKHRARYIVMGSHGHTGFYDLLIGSTTSGVLRRAPCPLVVVRDEPSRDAPRGG